MDAVPAPAPASDADASGEGEVGAVSPEGAAETEADPKSEPRQGVRTRAPSDSFGDDGGSSGWSGGGTVGSSGSNDTLVGGAGDDEILGSGGGSGPAPTDSDEYDDVTSFDGFSESVKDYGGDIGSGLGAAKAVAESITLAAPTLNSPNGPQPNPAANYHGALKYAPRVATSAALVASPPRPLTNAGSSAYPLLTRMQKRLSLLWAKPLILLVAGVGFEPTTFRL
ncbi:hypothetical protein KAJ83_16015 [Marivibrio halodurans]|uniref:Uncharacterized protein n=1 Tax=Marivibrio halodurans TaxID=2039722 RepID=A0A8J7SPB2_9PROT|nr:hypothetical protein [Marivibrio halodurans]MBP5858528.1 hypothetical protein [Marivibrio halodurans]